ncbi:hypothetical protein CPB86DRAFT_829104 [Serendipita vermifera]|nr:hypothetical protein CPB86DRAFT_829104 [Serendipita vermifera]
MSLSRHKAEESFRLSSLLVLSLVLVATTQIISESLTYYDAIVLDKLLHLLVLNVIFTPSAWPNRTPATRLLFRFVPCCSSAYGLYLWYGWTSSKLRTDCDTCIYIAWFGLHAKAEDPTFLSLFSSMHLLNLTFNVVSFIAQLRLEMRAIFALVSSRGLRAYYISARKKQQRDRARLKRLKELARQDWFFWVYWAIFWVFEHLDRPQLQLRYQIQIDGPFLLLYRVFDYVVTVYFLEHMVIINKAMLLQGGQGWGFSQVLSMLAIVPPLVLLARTFIDPGNEWRDSMLAKLLSDHGKNNLDSLESQAESHPSVQWKRVQGTRLYEFNSPNLKQSSASVEIGHIVSRDPRSRTRSISEPHR